MSPEPHTPVALSGSARTRVLIVLLSSLFLSLLTVSIVDVALPSIQREIGANASEIQWALSGYALAVGIVLVAAGRAGDVLGRGKLFIAGTAVFAIGSAIATFAPTPLVLDVGRAIMGFGAGLYSPQVGGLIQQHYQGRERAQAFGAFGAVVGIAVAIGPTLGGVLLAVLPESLGWRATLGINIPVALVVIVVASLWIPKDSIAPEARGKLVQSLDPLGSLILGVAIVGLMLPFILSQSPWRWWFLAAGVVLVAVWWAWELFLDRRNAMPMVSPSLLKIPTFSLGSLMISVFFAGGTSIPVIIALYVQSGLGKSALVSGFIMLPQALAQVVSSSLSGNLVWKHGRKLVVAGVIINMVAIAGLSAAVFLVSHGISVWWMVIPSAVLGFGGGWVTSPNQALALRDVPVSTGGTASGVMQTGQRIATALGIAMCTGLFYSLAHIGFDKAFHATALVVLGFEFAALVIALIDQRLSQKASAHGSSAEATTGYPAPADAVMQVLAEESE